MKMTSFLRPHWIRLSLKPSTSQPPTQSRCLSSTCPARAENSAKNSRSDEEDARPDRRYEGWMQSEGRRWQHPNPSGPKWLGGSVPFPRNPTFQPPTPLSDNLRSTIYKSYVLNPTANDPHTLSTRYGVSIKRVEAIIRLKHLEAQWVKETPLQTGFLRGMECILGVTAGGRGQTIQQEISSLDRSDVNEADELSRRANEDDARKRGLGRTFFEPVDEGQEPVVPGLLDEHRQTAAATRAKRPEYPTLVVQPNPSKPAFKFVDVGLRWFDAKDAKRRQKESVRRKAIKIGKRTVTLASTASTSPA